MGGRRLDDTRRYLCEFIGTFSLVFLRLVQSLLALSRMAVSERSAVD
jgi:hypothetical protein